MNNQFPSTTNANQQFSVSCKKVRFNDEKSALFTLKKILQTTTRKKKPVRAYKCKICNSWHLTSKLDYTIVEEENKRLKLEIESLNQKLKDVTSAENRKLKLETRVNDQVAQLKKQFKMMADETKKLRNEKRRIQEELILLKLAASEPKVSEKTSGHESGSD